ncbi:type 2 lanthipeptide synthetase LanM family protein [Sphaerimonospora thailandensis]|uniref:Type 2 lantibiotic biosynthesis protein n=1 Tax=Sphaerimonospora thailandensis TaxID=795644 RepID=A0A8J3RDZ6_9ACTN|nr:type 2 lanthipeptide synthetase LanM family protein [Sphaerimonospora thailandensis]GIH72102.1 type 2 lantibiotic biosynthesis protein [Sphaerimonospora thailandensis]
MHHAELGDVPLPLQAVAGRAAGLSASCDVALEPEGVGVVGAKSFSTIFSPFVGNAADRLVAECSCLKDDLDLAQIRDRFAADLSAMLVRIAGRVLAFELDARRAGGRLSGATPAERFADFVRQMTKGGLDASLKAYPVLGELLAQAADRAVDSGQELLKRFAADHLGIRESLGCEPGSLVEFTATGDPHLGGRAVSVLTFDTGVKIVYRPRPVEAHLRFNEVVRWLNGRAPDLGLRTLRVMGGERYGWAEFVQPRPCADVAEVEAFYRRTGGLLALLYTLNAGDIHYENVIACGDQPVLVDVETLFHPVITGTAVIDPALLALHDSVQRTAMLPTMLTGDQGSLDVSALGGDKDSVYPFSAAAWQDAGTDEMRLVRGPVRFAGADNRPRLCGVDADPADYAPSLLAGFREAYEAIVSGREELARGLLPRFGQVKVRMLLRPTRVYDELLTESTHPDVMADAAGRDEGFFELLRAMSVDDSARLAAIPAERADLRAGDIPYFWASPGSRAIYGGDTGRLPWELPQSGLESVAGKLSRMGPADRERQEWVIAASLATRVGGRGHDPGAPVDAGPLQAEEKPRPELLLAAADSIADRLCRTLYRQGRAVNWLGLEALDDRRFTIMPLGGGLATGYLGVALFLAQSGHATGTSGHMEIARQALEPIPRLLETLAAHRPLLDVVGCGGFGGLGGMAYALSQLGDLLGDGDVAGWVEPAVELAGAAVTDESPLDVYDGVAGCLAAMLAVHDVTGSPSAARLAGECAERLEPAAPSADLPPGFAFGLAGVGWALARYGSRTTGADLLERAAQSAEGQTWCHGLPGVWLALADVLPDALALPDDPASLPPVLDVPLGGHGLCHGELGSLEALSVLAARGDQAARRSLRRRVGRLLTSVNSGARCGTPGHISTPGLLDGMAGIGHGLLRLVAPESTASVLLLRSSSERREK